MAYRFHPISGRICMLCGMFVIMGRSWTEYISSRDPSTASRNYANLGIMENGGEPEFPNGDCKEAVIMVYRIFLYIVN